MKSFEAEARDRYFKIEVENEHSCKENQFRYGAYSSKYHLTINPREEDGLFDYRLCVDDENLMGTGLWKVTINDVVVYSAVEELRKVEEAS